MNLNRGHEENVAAMHAQTEVHQAAGVDVIRIGVMAAFGCNFQGDIPVEQRASARSKTGLPSPMRMALKSR